MYAVVKELRRVIYNHRFRHQLDYRVASVFGRDSPEYRVLMSTIDLVSETHDKGRRLDGKMLKSHEFAMFAMALVYCGIRDLPILLAILLHDMHEDYPEIWPLERINSEHGPDVELIVHAVTKPERQLFVTEEVFEDATFDQVSHGGIPAIKVKSLDRLHNMLTLYGDPAKKMRKVIQTIKYVLPLSAELGFLTYELMQATTEQMTRLKMRETPCR
jgi:(p)ppGpp synthase/HD superfamily hydrolase